MFVGHPKMKTGVEERIDASVLRKLGNMDRMKNSRNPKSIRMGLCRNSSSGSTSK